MAHRPTEPTEPAPAAASTAPAPAPGPPAGAAPPLGRRDAALALGLAAALTALYAGASDLLPGHDATGSVYTAATLLATGQPALSPARVPFLFTWQDRRPGRAPRRLHDLGELVDGVPAAARVAAGELVPLHPYYLVRAAHDDPATGEARFVNAYGPGAPLSALPVLAPLHLLRGDLTRQPALLWAGARLAAALLTAAAAALLYLAARRWLAARPAAGLALLFALGTPAWSVSSQTLWQHPGDLLLLSLGALALTRLPGAPGGPGTARAAALAGLAFSAAAACRPQSALFALVAFGWLALADRRAAAAFAAGALGPTLLLLAWNGWYLGGPLRFGQSGLGVSVALAKTGVADPWPFRLHESLPGLLVSPSRGLLVFSPFLALAAGGAALAWRRPEHRALRPLAVAVALLLVVEGAWFDWWGGWSYGWRRLLGLAPALTLLLVPLAPWLAAARWRRALLGALAAWAVALQGLGALAYDLSGWNARMAWRMALPAGREVLFLDGQAALAAQRAGAVLLERRSLDVDAAANRARLWSLADSQVAFTASHLGASRRSRQAMAAAWPADFAPTQSSAARP